MRTEPCLVGKLVKSRVGWAGYMVREREREREAGRQGGRRRERDRRRESLCKMEEDVK